VAVRRPVVQVGGARRALPAIDMLPIGPAGNLSFAEIDFSYARVQAKTITLATNFTCSGFSSNGQVDVVRLYLTNAGNYVLGFPSNWQWPGKKVPTFTANGRDVLVLTSFDGGVTVDVEYSLNKGVV